MIISYDICKIYISTPWSFLPGDYEISDNYLKSQGLHLTKLRSNDYIIACLGMTSDPTLLIMEAAPLGNLRHYLETKANETYYNMTSVKTSEIIFINQIIEGVNAVHHLGLPGLFYCLCASNVLLSSDQKCKLSGFASEELVRAREKCEEENNLPRPIQWLAPEAIKLSHVIESDIWSLGLLMWEIFNAGKFPFGDVTDDEARQKVLTGLKPIKPTKCSDDMYDIMTHCWMRQPYNRPSLHDISVKCNEPTQFENV
ncbi:hypothetical protein LSH36_1714g00008 [Paralvinella palmiformis]|uniref:Protein kinase domain-containing protein n=1 Tax=Paralvinella palmiformis TaxID=53620 RepID=A0AAD9MM38_9ANNE|nr:hypothetical protein LSH36_1714g00008 [Paralvinella palmiformis]